MRKLILLVAICVWFAAVADFHLRMTRDALCHDGTADFVRCGLYVRVQRDSEWWFYGYEHGKPFRLKRRPLNLPEPFFLAMKASSSFETRGRPVDGPARSARKGRNELKRIVLAVCENRGWLSSTMIRHLAGYKYIRPINYSLERYAKFGWLHRRGAWNAKPVMYRITNKGKGKLDWLRKTMP